MAQLKILFYYVLCTTIIVTAQYADDPVDEYNDFDLYEDLSIDRSQDFGKKHSSVQDDFYVMETFRDTENQRDVNSKDHPASFQNNIDFFPKDSFDEQLNWYKLPDKVYRYTKHRIPGFDYDEFDYMRSRSFQECDDRSVWTHCLCQFTCSEPDVVDCYTPCRSGCECKEEYVFDKKTQRCLLPEHCPSGDNFNYQI